MTAKQQDGSDECTDGSDEQQDGSDECTDGSDEQQDGSKVTIITENWH